MRYNGLSSSNKIVFYSCIKPGQDLSIVLNVNNLCLGVSNLLLLRNVQMILYSTMLVPLCTIVFCFVNKNNNKSLVRNKLTKFTFFSLKKVNKITLFKMWISYKTYNTIT